MVRDARVVAVIDWAFAGWYPEYWEYTRAHYNWFPRDGWADYRARGLPRMRQSWRRSVSCSSGCRSRARRERLSWRACRRSGRARAPRQPGWQHGHDSHTFAASDASVFDPVTFRLTSSNMDCFLDAKGLSKPHGLVDPASSGKLIGRLVVGELPADVTPEALHAFLHTVPLPVKKTHPQQSCVTWAVAALAEMQTRGWLRAEVDPAAFKDAALAYADARMSEDATEPPLKEYGA